MAKALVDTNCLLDYPEIFDNLNDEIIIHSIICEELDNIIHNSLDEEKKYKARQARNFIKKARNKIYSTHSPSFSLPLGWDYNKNDNKILAVCKDLNYTLITNDLAMQIKADSIGVKWKEYGKVDKEKLYTGYKEVILDEFELANFYEVSCNKWDLLENQYLIIKNQDNETVDIRKWTNKGFIELKSPNIKGIKAKNDLQLCAFDLMNSPTPIKILIGKPGSGKTIINLRSALYFLDKGKFQRIIYIRNPIGKGEQIGYLPGNQFEKLEPFAQAVVDNLEMGEVQFKQLIFQERLQFECPYFIKGASKESSWFLVDEAEDLNVETLRLIGTRLAKDSVICFSGDLYQTEKKYKHNNGLMEFINKFKGHPLVGIVKLENDVRSEVSKLFGEL